MRILIATLAAREPSRRADDEHQTFHGPTIKDSAPEVK